MPPQYVEREPIADHPNTSWREPLGHIVSLAQVEADTVQWLSPGRLAAGKITVLDGETPPSLAFRLQAVPRLGVTRVIWEGSSTLTAATLLQASSESPETRSALSEARRWLRQTLANGPRQTKELEQEARARGIAFRTLVEARKAEGVIARKEQTRNGRWLLSLPVKDPPS